MEGRKPNLPSPLQYRLPTEQEAITFGKNSKFQEAVLQNTFAGIIDAVPDPVLSSVLSETVEAREDKNISLLLKRLRHFCRKNTTDYFVHKNLDSFLKQELEFYIKDQVLHLADLDGDFEGKRRTLRTLRELAGEIITFLSQIEEVQKRLFEKRKFVLRADYLVPIKEVPRQLWKEVLKNKAQIEAWKTLFHIEPEVNLFNKNGTVNMHFLEGHPTLVVNTEHFGSDFKDKLLSDFEDIDEATDGLLIHSENYQALRLLERKYAGKVKCIYIDPPYNTGSD
jgi:adenine-specific DNA-methyltransferase